MNAYYHEFSVGFNWWMVAMILFAVIAIVFGIGQTYLKRVVREQKIIWKLRYRYNDLLFMLLGVVAAIVITIMLFVESFDGVIQSFDNSLGRYESPVWSLILAPGAIVFVGAVFGCLIDLLAIVASKTKVAVQKFYWKYLRYYVKKVKRNVKILVREVIRVIDDPDTRENTI